MGKGKRAGTCLGVAGLLMNTGCRSMPSATHGNNTISPGLAWHDAEALMVTILTNQVSTNQNASSLLARFPRTRRCNVSKLLGEQGPQQSGPTMNPCSLNNG